MDIDEKISFVSPVISFLYSLNKYNGNIQQSLKNALWTFIIFFILILVFSRLVIYIARMLKDEI